MVSFSRSALTDFDFGVPLYAGATVTAWTVDASGNKTATMANLWADLTSQTLLQNPQTLDGNGQWRQPVYIDNAVILTITGVNGVPDHQTGVIAANLAGSAATDAAASAASAAGYFGSVSDIFGRVRSLYNKVKTQVLPQSLVALNMLRVKADGSGYELRSPGQVRGDLGLGSAALLSTGTAAGNVPLLQTNGAAVGFAALDGSLLTGINRPSVRQTVLDGPVDANGVSATIAASATALGVDLKATSSGGITVTWANGFTAAVVDIVQTIPLDLANYWAALPTANTSYLAMDYAAGAQPTAVQTLAPPQTGRTYNQAAQSVLQFGGAAGSTIFLDDFGNVWTAQGGAKVQTSSFKFGTGALGGGGAGNAMNGTSDFLKCSGITSLGSGGWAVRFWMNAATMPAAGGNVVLASARNAGVGNDIFINNAAGVIKFGINLSSTGTSLDVAAQVAGTIQPVAGTWYYIELTFDALAGVYRFYVNGTQDISVASSARLCKFDSFCIGATSQPGGWFNGYIDKFEILPYCQHPNGTAYVPPAAAPNIAAAGYASDWFDTVNYQLKSVSGPSVAAGTNPTFTQKNRLYIGEADTVGGVVSTVRPYAISGEYVAPWVTPLPGAGTVISKNDNLGTDLKDVVIEAQNLTADIGFSPGQITQPFTVGNASFVEPFTPAKLRNITSVTTGSSTAWAANNASSGASVNMTVGNWQYRIRARRRW